MQAAAASLEAGAASGVESPAHATPLQAGNGVRVRVSAYWAPSADQHIVCGALLGRV